MEDNKYRKFTRGKYILWFFIEFVRSVYNNIEILFPSIGLAAHGVV